MTMNEKMKNLSVRTASGAVLAAIVIGAVLWSVWSFGALILAIIIGGTAEFYRLCDKGGIEPMKIVGMITAAAVFAVGFSAFSMLSGVVGQDMIWDLLYVTAACGIGLIVVIIPAAFACELWRKSGTPIANIAATFMGVVYVAVPMTMLFYIQWLAADGVQPWNPWVVLSYISVIWINDIFAYLVGVCCGRHKMFPRISPKKSWEGFCGGIVAATAAGVLCGRLLGGNMAFWGVLALIVAVTGVAGDLVESLFKRSVGVKDSGSIMPGHGGFLDRFDAMLFSAPFAFVYVTVLRMVFAQ